MNKHKLSIIIGILIIILSNSSCAATDERKKVIGKWKVEKVTTEQGTLDQRLTKFWAGKPLIEFFSDNTFVQEGNHGKWILLEDGRIKMERFGIVKFAKIKDNKMIYFQWFKDMGLDCVLVKEE